MHTSRYASLIMGTALAAVTAASASSEAGAGAQPIDRCPRYHHASAIGRWASAFASKLEP